MGSVIADGLAWLNEQRKANASETVVYSRDVVSGNVDATIGATDVDLADAVQIGVSTTTVDFIAALADLPVSEPKDGDRITRVVGGSTLVYEAMPIASGEPAWRYTDETTRTEVRIHTKLVSIE